MDKNQMLKLKNWAVYGITPNDEKFGYKIPELMKELGYNVVGVNPKYKGEEIAGIYVYGSLLEVEQEIDAIDVIVSPKISLDVIDQAKEKNIKNIWFQPGSYDEKVIEKVKQTDMNYVDDDCVYAILSEE